MATINVVELVNSFRFYVTETGISAYRTFIDPGDGTVARLIPLPEIGSLFTLPVGINSTILPDNQKFEKLYCRKRNFKKFGNDVRKNIFTVFYTNEITDSTQYALISTPSEKNSLPNSVETGGEFLLISFPQILELEDKYWAWEEGGDRALVNQGLAKKVCLVSFKYTRIIAAANIGNHFTTIVKSVGTVNSDEVQTSFGKLQPGTVLFNGSNMSQFLDNHSAIKYRVEMMFVAKNTTGVSGGSATDQKNGWNFIINVKTGSFDIPVRNGTSFSYGSSSFAELFK